MKALLAHLYRAVASPQSSAVAWLVIVVLVGMLVMGYAERY